MTVNEMYSQLTLKKDQLGIYYYFGIIQLSGGLRVSEVLNIKAHDLIPYQTIFIKGLKGSQSKRVYVPECEYFIRKCLRSNLEPFKGISRFMVYRLYKRLGFVILKGNGTRNAVTHSIRKQAIKELHASTRNIKDTASAIGHKSSKSTEYYVKR